MREVLTAEEFNKELRERANTDPEPVMLYLFLVNHGRINFREMTVKASGPAVNERTMQPFQEVIH